LRAALAYLVAREQDKVVILASLPEFTLQRKMTFLHDVISSSQEGMAMDANVVGSLESHAVKLECVIYLIVRERAYLENLLWIFLVVRE